MAIKKDYPIEKLVPGNSPITIEMVGKKFGRLTIISYPGNKVYPKGFVAPMVLAKCECGSTHLYIATKIRTGYSKSCGCFQLENSVKLHTKHGQKSTQHGNRGTIIYSRWRSMFDRVRSDKRYAHVKIDDRWKGDDGFVNFCNDIGPMPTPKHTVDRYPIIRGNYEPGNVRWATMREQMQNTEKNVNIMFRGELLCISEIARRVGVDQRALSRIYRNKNIGIEDAIVYINTHKRKK